METKALNHRQVRSYLVLTRYDFVLNHRPGSTNPADGPSRRPDYMAEAQKPAQKYNEAFVQPMRDILNNRGKEAFFTAVALTRSGRRSDAPNSLNKALNEYNRAERVALEEPKPPEDLEVTEDDTDSASEDSDSEMDQNRPLQPRIGSSSLRELTDTQSKAKALEECHDNPLAGHFGSKRTLEKLQRRYTWKGMRKDVADYCRDCLACRKATPARHKPYGPLAPLPPPDRPWEEATMDFVTELPPSKIHSMVYDAILVVVCRLTKMAHYIPARGDWDGTDLAQAWIREVVRLHGVPKRIISDRGPLMNAKHWDTFQHYLNSRRVLTSAFHPQTDGQTERQNQTLEQYLRCYCTLEQDDWALWISIGEFAYNDSVHATTGLTPFRAYHGIDPRRPDWPSMAQGDGESPMGFATASKVLSLQSECKRKILAANAYQKAYTDNKRLPITFKVGDQVLVSNRHMRSTRPKKKLDWKYVGPGRIIAQNGPSAFTIDLPELKNVHPIFHASLLEPYSPTGDIPHPEGPSVDTLREFGDDVYDVDRILERRRNEADQWEYLVQWKGYPVEENSWEPGPNISAEALKKFWDEHNILPRRQSRKEIPKRGRGRPPKKKEDSSGQA